MPLVGVTDPADPRLADYRDLRDVQLRSSTEVAEGLFLAEGEKVIRRAVAAGFSPRSFLVTEKWLPGLADVLGEAPVLVATDAVIETLTGFAVHRGALASFERRPLPPLAEVLDGARRAWDIVDHGTGSSTRCATPRIAILEDLVDHANVGAAFRNAAALGVQAVLLSPRCADPLYRRAVKVSMGATLQIPWTRLESWPDDLAVVKDAKFVVWGFAVGAGSVELEDLPPSPDGLAMMFGTEGNGLTARALDTCDQIVRIPMDGGIDSLNVAAATAVAFYATRRRDADF